MKLVDLHTHTTASDGSMTPAALVEYAAGKGLAAIAVTDHDTLAGLEEAVEEGHRRGLEVIAGLEISVDFDPEMHMLGYFMDGIPGSLEPVLAGLKAKREERNPRIVAKLREMGFDITLEEAASLAGGKIVGRPHIAETLVRHGYVGSVAEAFEKYLASGKPAYFKKDKLTPAEGVNAVLEAGGIPVLAHPVHLNMSMEKLDELLGRLVADGLMGMEAIYVDNTGEQTERLLELCTRHGLLATGGSDFHGRFKPDIDIGCGRGNLKISYEIVEKLKDAQKQRKKGNRTNA